MLSVKNAVKSVVRTPGRSFLFLLLLTAVTVVLVLGSCIYFGVSDYLDLCNENYHTIAELEYLGQDYPNPDIYDPYLVSSVNDVDINAMRNIDGVISFEPNMSAVAFVKDYYRSDKWMFDKDAAVLLIDSIAWDRNGESFLGVIEQCLYSRKDYSRTMVFLTLDALGLELGADNSTFMERRGVYLVAGHFVEGGSSYLWFRPENLRFVIDGEVVEIPALTQLKTLEEAKDRSLYSVAAEMDALINNAFKVQFTSNIDDLRPFQQEELSIISGRTFTSDEYAEQKDVCLISDKVADFIGAGVGDTISLSVNCYEGSAYNIDSLSTAPYRDFEVVGIYAFSTNYPCTFFIPYADAYDPYPVPTGYTVGQFRIENDKADAFYAQASKLLPVGYRLTVYDQGYSITAVPFKEFLEIAKIFLSVCIIVIIAVLVLYGYLFITRQRDSAYTMIMLGTKKGSVLLYFAVAALLLALPALLIGSVISSALESGVFEMVARFGKQFQNSDVRFSSSALSLVHTLEFNPDAPLRLYLICAAALLSAILITCVLFAAGAMRQKKQKRKKKKAYVPKKGGRTVYCANGIKYAVLSIARGRWRTAAVVVFSLFVAVFLGGLTSTSLSYDAQLAAIKENTVIYGYGSSINGLSMNNLVLKATDVQKLYDTGVLKSLDLSRTLGHWRYIQTVVESDGTINADVPITIPDNSFAFETFMNQLNKEPQWVSTTSIKNTPEFFYAQEAEIDWLDGYGEDVFLSDSLDVCILPETFAAQQGIKKGSVIRVLSNQKITYQLGRGRTRTGEGVIVCDLLVVGIYVPQGTGNILYTPIDYALPVGREIVHYGTWRENIALPPSSEDCKVQSNLDKYSDSELISASLSFSGMIFSTFDARDLTSVRDALAASGFSVPNTWDNTRTWAVLEDKACLALTGSLERHIRYLSVLYAFLYILTGIISIVLSVLLLSSRKAEIAIMYGLGTPKARIRSNMLFEQFVLSLLSAALGLAIHALVLGRPVSGLLLVLCSAFVACWMVGALIRVNSILKSDALAVLSDPE